jgi:predicted nucleic acid-binding protein
MTQSVLIDTDIVSAHFKGDPVVESKLLLAEMICLPSIVLGELYFGANWSENRLVDRHLVGFTSP